MTTISRVAHASLKSVLPILGAISTTAMLSALPLTSAQAAGNYYNCAVPNGCEKVSSRYFTSSYTKTKHPIVMAHGILGWNRALETIDYFYGIPQTLMRGGSNVYTTKVSSLNNIDVRGEQLLKQVKTISAISGSNKVNLVGHSQGGMDSRYVAGVAPEYVASVTGVSTPVQGSDLADWIQNKIVVGSATDGYPEGEFNPASVATIDVFDFIGKVLDVASGVALDDIQDQNTWQALSVLTTDHSHEFNARFPAATPSQYCGYASETKVNGIEYYSFGGNVPVSNIFDITDPVLLATNLTFSGPNDGFVPTCSMHLGQVIRDDYKMNHLDTINHFIGLVSLREVNPRSVYRSQINRIKNKNL